ncbi:cystine/glutamate transporter-like isoform X1 [Haliotis asinina]|uniref:cystine/glutamate transporter-like isoform X1 n=1 Tax=Haliotis asinina TaxID=109174 RepID=UPI003532147D
MGDMRETDSTVEDAVASRGDKDGPKVVIESKVQMKQSMNLFHCTALLVSITGHSAVFIAPSTIVKFSGSVGMSLVAWMVGGLINLSLALCFTELGTMMPKAGGPYAFIYSTFGSLPGFLILWGYIVLISGPFWAFQSKTAAVYVVKAIFPGCDIPEMEWGIKMLAAWIIVTLVTLNCVYMKYVTRVQTFLSSTKMLAMLIIIAGGIAMFAKGNTEYFESPFEDTSTEAGDLSLAIFFSLFGYGGWQVLLSLSEEVKNPGRVLPLSVFMAFFIIILKTLLVNVAYFTLISPAEMAASRAVGLLFVERLYPPLVPVISFLVGTITVGALNAGILGHSRLLFAGSRVGHASTLFGMIHQKYLTPGPSIVVLAVWSLVMLFVGGFTTMMRYITLFSNTMSMGVVVALLYLRWVKPSEPRPYKVPLFVPILQVFVVMFILVLAVYQNPLEMGTALLILSAGVPVYFVVTWTHKPRFMTRFIGNFTVAVQKLFFVVKTS